LKILIIGGTGFIGSHLVKQFAAMNYKVLSLSRSCNSDTTKKYLGVDYIEGDLSDKNLLFKITLDVDVIVHCGSSHTPLNPDKKGQDENNSENLVESFFYNKVKKFVYFSSGGAIYGNNSLIPFKESAIPNPLSIYGKSKLKIEGFLLKEFQNHEEKLLILRPSNPYGPPQTNRVIHGIIPSALSLIKNKESLKIYGDGSAFKDFIHINDLVTIACNLSTKNNFGIYNIGSGKRMTINKLVSTLFKITNSSSDIIYLDAFNEDVSFLLSTEKVFSAQPHKNLIDIEEGISSLWNQFYL
tara:strand:+ start:5850 stop:6743 length:894 start_codon:yes stop_codon:yes gene_type:complete